MSQVELVLMETMRSQSHSVFRQRILFAAQDKIQGNPLGVNEHICAITLLVHKAQDV
jgi:hypothetical protein